MLRYEPKVRCWNRDLSRVSSVAHAAASQFDHSRADLIRTIERVILEEYAPPA
jgi:hypothetical protein